MTRGGLRWDEEAWRQFRAKTATREHTTLNQADGAIREDALGGRSSTVNTSAPFNASGESPSVLHTPPGLSPPAPALAPSLPAASIHPNAGPSSPGSKVGSGISLCPHCKRPFYDGDDTA